MKQKICNVTVTWLDSNHKSECCVLRTDCDNERKRLLLDSPNQYVFVIDISNVRGLYLDADNPKRLMIDTTNNRLWLEFIDSRQSAAWLKRIKDLRNDMVPVAKKQEVQVPSTKRIVVANTTDDNMEIPYTLRADAKLTIAETGLLGPIGAFSSVADIASIAGWWGYLLVQYAKYYGMTLDKEDAKKICSTALLGMGGYYLGCKTASKLFHLIPGAGSLAAMGISSLQNIIFTYRFAITLTRIFSNGNLDYDTLVESIKFMFAGVAIGIASVKDIVELFLNY